SIKGSYAGLHRRGQSPPGHSETNVTHSLSKPSFLHLRKSTGKNLSSTAFRNKSEIETSHYAEFFRIYDSAFTNFAMLGEEFPRALERISRRGLRFHRP